VDQAAPGAFCDYSAAAARRTDMHEAYEQQRIEWINRHAYIGWHDLETEHKQALEEGRDLSDLENEFARLLNTPAGDKPLSGARDGRWLEDAGRLMDRVQEAPLRRDYPYVEPDDLAAIQAARPPEPPLKRWDGSRDAFIEHLHGGLLGRICGCMLGKPVEGWPRHSIEVTARATGNWPLADYLRQPTPEEDAVIAAANPKRQLNKAWKGMLRGTMDGMVEDDDTNYTVIGFAVVKQYGKGFTPADVATFWAANVPVLHTYTAERVAYRNLCMCIAPPRSAVYRNPYREWIGAQIRADYFGYANPGNPAQAAEWAWRDACISHVRNGIYGEMWVAAMLAAAYVETDWVRVIRAGLAQIPARCRLAEDIGAVLDAWQRRVSYEQVVEMIRTRWNEADRHHWCHTNSNAQIVAAALLWGEDDYGKTICRAVMPGFDTDCNGATAGSLWGVMHGASAIPDKWSGPMKNLLRTGVAGYHTVSISELAREMVEVALR